MDTTFDADAFIARIGKRLVEQFDDARAATSPGTVGAAMEQPVKRQMEQILPRGIEVGSGFVIDSDGGTSQQTDIVLYERDICPVFSINDTPETTYYPCEGVIAVGEVKSRLDRGSLEDAFKKIASVKRLKRHVIRHPVPLPSGEHPIFQRGYGMNQGDSILTVTEAKETHETSHILGFVIAGDLRIQSDTLCEAFRQFNQLVGDSLSPNLVAILNGGILTWGNITKEKLRETKWSDQRKGYILEERDGKRNEWKVSWSAQKADWFQYSQEEDAFRTLIRWINQIYREGKTSDARSFDRYFLQKSSSTTPEVKYVPKADMTMEAALKNLGIQS